MKDESRQETVLRGIVRRVTYRHAESGYTVLRLSVEDEVGEVTVVGHHLNAAAGAHLILRGAYQQHHKFGTQFLARNVQHVAPSSPAGMERYLAGGSLKGIGRKTAQRIVAAFGDKTFEILQREPERLHEVPGIGKRKAEQIRQAFSERRDRVEIDRFFAEHNISLALTEKVYQKFGVRAVETVKEDPYLLAYRIRGVGFLTADALALKLGLALDAPQRLQAGLYYALEKAKEDGNCFLRRESLGAAVAKLLGLAAAPDLSPHLSRLCSDGYVVVREDDVYLRPLYEAEQFVAHFIADRAHPFPRPMLAPDAIAGCIAASEGQLGLNLSHEQRHAVHLAAEYPLLAVTGGPGCGKTTLIKSLVTVFQQAGKTLALAAPTGKAAQKMAQVCGLPASTIHRLLGFDPRTSRFRFGAGCPLQVGEVPRQVEALIVDEASMIDILLARDLFAAIPRNAVLILVGDKDQLPSVGPGRVFADILAAGTAKTIALSRLFRRSETSLITTIAHQVNAGIVPEIPTPDGRVVDAYFIERSDYTEAASLIERLVTDQIPQKRGIAPHDITVLTPSNIGPLGTVELNRLMQQRVNAAPGAALQVGAYEFRSGDRVCQRVNNYQIDPHGVFNGDTGVVCDIDARARSLTVELWDGRLVQYSEHALEQLSLGYAMTVHRSQGSEMPCVILVLHEAHFILLERQLLYTAITRAKNLLFVVGTQRGLQIATRRTRTTRRLSRLQESILTARG